jgi:nucleoside-diphosphate-sugar epimerase
MATFQHLFRAMPRVWLTREVLIRVVADIILINTGLLTALAVSFGYLVASSQQHWQGEYQSSLWHYLAAFWSSSCVLTPLYLVAFALSGVYTHGRSARLRHKVLLIVEATSLSYLIYAGLSYFSGGELLLSGGTIFLAWVLTTFLVIAARLWLITWNRVVKLDYSGFKPATEFKPCTVLVIGGAGYIGSGLLPRLLEKGYRVRLLDLLLYGVDPIKQVLNHPMLEVIQADFRQVDQVVKAMQEVDEVIHLGAIVGDPACAFNEQLTIEVNLMATRMIAEVAKGVGVKRFIFASTCSVYGVSDEILNEHSALNPVSLYARSKIASERILQEMADEHFSPVILRFGTIYGLSGRTRFDLVVNLLTAKAVFESKITVTGGDQWRPFVHVDDAALAVFKALEAPQTVVHNQIFNVGSNSQNFTIQQVGEVIHRLVPTAVLINGELGTDRRNYKVSFNKISELLSFAPNWTLEQGIQQVIEAVRSGRVKNYHDASYSNVLFLQQKNTTLHIRYPANWMDKLLNETVSDYETNETLISNS